jgi:tRNA1(Val) A37 N6-methylase TrmN6
VLAGNWRIVQLRGGHRFSADDLLTAWAAIEARPQARNLLDLGAGIGSVGLLALWRLSPDACLTMVEVQTISHLLARETVAVNGLERRVMPLHQDLRHWPGGEFDLVTGSPPYIPIGKGTVSPHPQKAACRFELHGNVVDYCAAARRSLAPGGAFCFCHAASDPRPERAIRDAGLACVARQRVYFRAGCAPSIALYTCARGGRREELPPLYIRDADGNWTDAYLQIRERMGAPPRFLDRARDRRPTASPNPQTHRPLPV